MCIMPNVIVVLCKVCKGTGLVFNYRQKCSACNGQGGCAKIV
jgi:DnaJ-class molecular chaperone